MERLLPPPTKVAFVRYECFSQITWALPLRAFVTGIEIERCPSDGQWEPLCLTQLESFVDVFDIIAPVYQYRIRLCGTKSRYSDWVVARTGKL
jgi:hypothetical protein